MKTEANSPIHSATETKIITIGDNDFDERVFHTGLTKREYFAAMAMQGEMGAGGSDFNTDHVNRIAEISVAMADALINELNKLK